MIYVRIGSKYVGFREKAHIHRDEKSQECRIVVDADGERYETDARDCTVSRQHLLIYREGNKYYAVDLGSLNGTYVNGMLIPGWRRKTKSASIEVKPGSRILIGETEVTLENDFNTITVVRGDIVVLRGIDASHVPGAKKAGDRDYVIVAQTDIAIEDKVIKVAKRWNTEVETLRFIKKLVELIDESLEFLRSNPIAAISRLEALCESQLFSKVMSIVDQRVSRDLCELLQRGVGVSEHTLVRDLAVKLVEKAKARHTILQSEMLARIGTV
jgi:hypothetical protein